MGLCYSNGTGVNKSDQEAFRWFKKSAENGDDWGQYNLGVLYDDGTGTAENKSLATKWYRKAAAQGNSSAKQKIPVKVGEIARDLSGKDLNGSKMSLSDHRGKLVLIDFWNPG